MKIVGTWLFDKSIELVELQGEVYALAGWDGEKYGACWKCTGPGYMYDAPGRYTLTPVYRFEAEHIDLSQLEEGSAEWEHAIRLVNYEVRSN